MSESSLKILSPSVASDRIINTYPVAYTKRATPYTRESFHPRIKTACANHQTGNADLRMSKVVVVGEVATGKTSLVNRFCHNSFNRDYKATIGVDFEVERLSILGTAYKLQMWDTAGQERFKSISSAYFRGAHIVIAVFDLNDPSTMERAASWMEEACETSTSSSGDPDCRQLRFLVGNKRDLISDARYSQIENDIIEMAHSLSAELWICSAKTGENVKEFFFRVTTLAFEDTLLKSLDTIQNNAKKGQVSVGAELVQLNTPTPNQSGSSTSDKFSCSFCSS